MRALVFALCFVGVVGCKKAEKKEPPPAPPPTTGVATADGVRKIAVEAGKDGYKPDRITGKPAEKLNLVFTRTVDAECLSQLKAPDGKVVDLPLNKPVEVAITVPDKGELAFACGMDMFHGTIVAQP